MDELNLASGVLAFDGRILETFSGAGPVSRNHVGVIEAIELKGIGKGKQIMNIRYRGGGHELVAALQITDEERPAVEGILATAQSAGDAWRSAH